MENNQTHRESLMNLMMKDVEQQYNAMHLLPCLWLTDAILTSRERKRRIVEGDEVVIKEGKLTDCNDLPTHEIVRCESNRSGTYQQIVVKDLNSHLISNVRI